VVADWAGVAPVLAARNSGLPVTILDMPIAPPTPEPTPIKNATPTARNNLVRLVICMS
jgi:hypothetical protein